MCTRGVVLGFFSFFSPYFLLSIKNCFDIGSDTLSLEEHFSGSHGTDQAPLLVPDNFLVSLPLALKPIKLSAICSGSEEVRASFALAHRASAACTSAPCG